MIEKNAAKTLAKTVEFKAPGPAFRSGSGPQRRRRFRDRAIDREGTENERLSSQHSLQNHLLLFDDDLRESAIALGGIESYLARALAVLERQDLTQTELISLASDLEVEAKVASLDETLASLKNRLLIIADQLK